MPEEKNIKAIILDIDGTLAPDISWTLLTRDLGASVEKHEAIFQAFQKNEISYAESKKVLLRLWKSTNKANYDSIRETLKHWPLHENALETVSYLKDRGYMLCLITGSFDLYAEGIAEKLGIDSYFANTKFHWDSVGNLIDYDYEKNQSQKKLEQFLSFCAKFQLEPQECAAVGDDENDRAIFEVANGIALHSSKSAELEKISWKVIHDIGELKGVL